MATDLKEIIEQLKLERDILKDGGYGRSVRTPWKPTTLCRDSITCLNYREAVKRRPCSECFWWAWVPEMHRREEIPCHFIPLNEKGDTIASLEGKGDRDGAEQALLGWLETTIKQLEKELTRREQVETTGFQASN